MIHRNDTYKDKLAFLIELAELWNEKPELRFGQLIVNALGSQNFEHVLFTIEDDNLEQFISQFVGHE